MRIFFWTELQKSTTKGYNIPSRPCTPDSFSLQVFASADPSTWNAFPWDPCMAGSFSSAKPQLKRTSSERPSLSTLFLVAHHSRITCSIIYPIFIFFPALIAAWKFLVIDVCLWLSVFPTRIRVSQGQGQWLLCFLTFLQNLVSHRGFQNIWVNECCPRGLQPQHPEGFASAEEHAPGSICPAFCAEWERQMGKERSAPGPRETLANKQPKRAVNAPGAAKEARYASYLLESQFGGYFCSLVYARSSFKFYLNLFP